VEALTFILAALGGYLLGSVPFGLVLTRLAGAGDIRQIGSGNIGATNVLRTGRKDLALATLVLDAGKAAAALLLARAFAEAGGFSEEMQRQIGLVAGGAAFVGHCYPVWLKFNGGKGVATFFGVLFAGIWPLGVFAGLTWIGVATLFRYSSLAALCAAAVALLMAIGGVAPDVATIVFTAVLAVFIFWRHRANIARLIARTEPRIGEKKEDAAPPAGAAAEPPASAE
jgi:glycerol-3-phosphate acyltransferase PlsY